MASGRTGDRGSPQVVPPHSSLHDAGVQPLDDQPDNPLVPDSVLKKPDQPAPRNRVEEFADVTIDHPVNLAPLDADRERIERIMRPTPGPEPVAEPQELRLVNRRQDYLRHSLLDDFVLYGRDAERSCAAIRLRNVHPP